jgi:hypothetical protein
VNNNGNKEEAAIKTLLQSFAGAYAERDKSVDFSNWLAGRLRQEMPDMSESAAKSLSEEIIEGVAGYDRTLGDLNRAVEAGQSGDAWLAERIAEACDDMPPGAAGGALLRIESDLNASNVLLMRELEDTPDAAAPIVVEAELIDWNEYSMKNKALDVGRQAVMAGLGAAANAVKNSMESGETADMGGVIKDALQDGLETARGEVKAVVAGAVKAAAEKGLPDMLPADTPTEIICDIAGAAVESASALFDAVTGKSTALEALDKAGRASVAVACRLSGELLKGTINKIPLVGPLVADLAGGLLDHMASSKFADNVYAVVRDAARATWQGIKESGRRMWNSLKNSVKQMQYN